MSVWFVSESVANIVSNTKDLVSSINSITDQYTQEESDFGVRFMKIGALRVQSLEGWQINLVSTCSSTLWLLSFSLPMGREELGTLWEHRHGYEHFEVWNLHSTCNILFWRVALYSNHCSKTMSTTTMNNDYLATRRHQSIQESLRFDAFDADLLTSRGSCGLP